MIIYVMAKEPKSILLDIQARLWREYHPQADFMVVTTSAWNIKHHVNHCLNMTKGAGHRFAFVIHEDCLPIKRMDPEFILKGHTLAGRYAPDRVNVHPSRTWMAADTTVEGKTWLGYGDREVTADDLRMKADDSLRSAMQMCEPGWLHLDNWHKRHSADDAWKAKRDWILSAYSDYAQLPSLTNRVLSFSRAMVDTAKSGINALVSPRVWESRLGVCNSCDAYDKGRCRYCGCGIKTKARLKSQHCPIGKWPMIEEIESVDDQNQG
jgi:hypothetical protein